jgi:hypothetical protein
MNKHVALGLWIAAIGLLGSVVALGIYHAGQRPATEPALTVDDAHRNIGEQPVGTVAELDYRIVNKSDQALRILGFGGG